MGLVGQNQQTSFSDPQAGQSPISAAVVRNNDNATRSKHNDHDADATIHVQTGLLSNRPAAGTAYAMYMDENLRLYQDSGSAWVEVPYARLDAAGVNAFVSNVTIGGTLGVTGNATFGGTVGVTGAATFGSTVAVTGNTTLANASVTDLTVNGTLTADGSSLTNLNASELTGALPAVSGASLTGLNASNIASGTLSATRLPATITSDTTGSAASVDSAGGSLTVAGADLMTLAGGAGEPALFLAGNTVSGASPSIEGPFGTTTRTPANDRFIKITSATRGDYYIRCERWA